MILPLNTMTNLGRNQASHRTDLFLDDVEYSTRTLHMTMTDCTYATRPHVPNDLTTQTSSQSHSHTCMHTLAHSSITHLNITTWVSPSGALVGGTGLGIPIPALRSRLTLSGSSCLVSTPFPPRKARLLEAKTARDGFIDTTFYVRGNHQSTDATTKAFIEHQLTQVRRLVQPCFSTCT